MWDIVPALRDRKSSRAFDPRPVERAKIDALIEAFRWGASSANRQPWRLLFAESAEARAAWDRCLGPANAPWAPHATVKIVVLGNPEEQPDAHGQQRYLVDCGIALNGLLVQACAMGLSVRAMADWSEQEVLSLFAVPSPFRVVALVAAGYPGRVEDLPPAVQEKERRPRTRKPAEQFVFRDRYGGAWGVSASPQ